MITEATLEEHGLQEWELREKGLTRVYRFATYAEAIAFVVQVGFAAEKHNHHPHLVVTPTKVTVTLQTHSEGGTVTDKDVQLAEVIDAML